MIVSSVYSPRKGHLSIKGGLANYDYYRFCDFCPCLLIGNTYKAALTTHPASTQGGHTLVMGYVVILMTLKRQWALTGGLWCYRMILPMFTQRKIQLKSILGKYTWNCSLMTADHLIL